MITLRPYQKKAVDGIARKFSGGINNIVFQLATGGGKSYSACGLIDRYLSAFPDKKIIFFVHREELLNQFRNSLFKFSGRAARKVMAGVKKTDLRPDDNVFVAMVETANNRLKKDTNFFGKPDEIGLVIFDEAHLGVHNKLHKYFDHPKTITVGLTTTPLSSQKKHPMKEFYEDIVSPISIKQLIEQGSLCQNLTYHIKGEIDDSKFNVTAGDFNNRQMGNEYSKSRNVVNTLKAYESKCVHVDEYGVITADKAVIFNCNIDHSYKVLKVFEDAGYPCRHLDGKTPKWQRKKTLKWLKETDGAVLMNVGVLTAGFDEPSLDTVIMNRSTLSLPLWLQCTGRASRPYPNKNHFKIIDLGGNALRHGDWSDDRDWTDIFFNPPKPSKKQGVAPVKECVNTDCQILIPVQSRICPHCETKQPIKEIAEDTEKLELELLNGHKVDMGKAIETAEQRNWNTYASLHRIKDEIVKNCRKRKMTVDIKNGLHKLYQQEVEKWCESTGKKYNRWHKETTRQWMNDAIKEKWIDGKKPPKKKKEIESDAMDGLSDIFNNPDNFLKQSTGYYTPPKKQFKI